MTRKEFLEESLKHAAVLAVAGCGAGASLLTSCTSVRYVSGVEQANTISIPLTEFAESAFVVVRKSGKLTAPVYLCKQANATGTIEYTALVMKCTHKGCEVRPAGDLLICPCHGSEFTNKGKVLSPPATENLHGFRTSVDGASILIHLQEGGTQ